MATNVLLDANMLLVPFQFNVDVFTEINRLFDNPAVYTLDMCVDEAKTVEDRRYEHLVDKLVETQDLTVITTDSEEHVDDLLYSYAAEGYIIATNDGELRHRLDDESLPVVYLRGENRLTVSNTAYTQ